jgi:hypothetical protein
MSLSRSIGAKPRSLARRWAGIGWWTVPLVYALLLAAPSVTLPGDDLGIRRFQTPQPTADVPLGQTFTMTGDGLDAIEVFPTAVGKQVSGSVLFVLYDDTDGIRLTHVRSADVRVEDLIKAPSYRFEFPPILDSEGRSYRLGLVPSAIAPAEGVAFWATKGERYATGSLRINNRDRWADLGFRAYAPAPSIWRLFMTLWDERPVRAYILSGSLIAVWLLLGLVIRELAGMEDTPGLAASVLTESR